MAGPANAATGLNNSTRAPPIRQKVIVMSNRRWVVVFLLVSVLIVCSIVAGARYYLSRCHGVDACAAAEAESLERVKPTEPQ